MEYNQIDMYCKLANIPWSPCAGVILLSTFVVVVLKESKTNKRAKEEENRERQLQVAHPKSLQDVVGLQPSGT